MTLEFSQVCNKYVSQFENKSVPLKPYLKRAQLAIAMYITQTMKAWSSDTAHFLMSKNVWEVKQIQPNIITSASQLTAALLI